MLNREHSGYTGQFDLCPDPLFVAIPRLEILTEMAVRGEHEALNDVCLAVAVVADILDGLESGPDVTDEWSD